MSKQRPADTKMSVSETAVAGVGHAAEMGGAAAQHAPCPGAKAVGKAVQSAGERIAARSVRAANKRISRNEGKS